MKSEKGQLLRSIIKKYILGITAVSLLAGILLSAPSEEVYAAGKAKPNEKSYSLNPGAQRTLAVSGGSGSLKWSVSNKKVVSIKKNGKKATITAKKKGNATVTAKIGKTALKCKVKVSGKKILVAYFSRSGNAKKVADYIHKQIGGDIVQIKTKKAYPSDYDKCTRQAEQELEDDARPEITTRIKNFAKYDEVVVGYPIWWGSAPRAVCTFVEDYDWSGKTLIPFCTSASSGLGDSAAELGRLTKGSQRTQALSAYEDDVLNKSLKKKIDKWLKKVKA